MTRNDIYTAAVILTIPAVIVAASWCALRARRLFDRWVETATEAPSVTVIDLDEYEAARQDQRVADLFNRARAQKRVDW